MSKTLEQEVVDGLLQSFFEEHGGGEWLPQIDGQEVGLHVERSNESQKKQGVHGVVSVFYPPKNEDEDDSVKKYALKVSVELIEIK
jgi:hypothetical protein